VKTQVLVKFDSVSKKKRVYAFSGWSGPGCSGVVKRAAEAKRWYRKRFGIETSYRQKNQARGWTTSCDEVYRLLLEGLSQLLRRL
jgi:hypothetical protein